MGDEKERKIKDYLHIAMLCVLTANAISPHLSAGLFSPIGSCFVSVFCFLGLVILHCMENE